MAVSHRLSAWLGVDEAWQRPRPTSWRADIIAVGVLVAGGVIEHELLRSSVPFDSPRWKVWSVFLMLLLPLLWRRRHPLVVALVSALGLFLVATWVPEVPYFTSLNAACFFGTFSGLAWARDRRGVPLTITAIMVLVYGWFASVFAWGNGVQLLIDRGMTDRETDGLLGPIPATILIGLMMNSIFFAGALALGQKAWRQARDQARLADQAQQLVAQQEELQERAVVDERLRIARELHDVAAQHVAAMGVQASAARRLMAKRPGEASVALAQVEDSARGAVAEMRNLLGTLRGGESADDSRAPEPGLDQLATLISAATRDGLVTSFRSVEERPGDLADVPGPIALTLYRTVQEALANVGKHSTGRTTGITLRTFTAEGRRMAEVEILDDGRLRVGTSGTGLGLLGIRERAATHRGTADIGPRVTGGYRVRVRIPLPEPTR